MYVLNQSVSSQWNSIILYNYYQLKTCRIYVLENACVSSHEKFAKYSELFVSYY